MITVTLSTSIDSDQMPTVVNVEFSDAAQLTSEELLNRVSKVMLNHGEYNWFVVVKTEEKMDMDLPEDLSL